MFVSKMKMGNTGFTGAQGMVEGRHVVQAGVAAEPEKC